MLFIGHDSIQTHCDSYLSLSNSPSKVASIQKNRGDKLHDYMMRLIGYDSIQTRWFISCRFQIQTILIGVTLQYPALKRFRLISADTWYGSNILTWINYNASVLQSLTYLLIRAHFSEMGRGQFNMSPFKALPILWDGSSFWWMGCWKFFMLPYKNLIYLSNGITFWRMVFQLKPTCNFANRTDARKIRIIFSEVQRLSAAHLRVVLKSSTFICTKVVIIFLLTRACQ